MILNSNYKISNYFRASPHFPPTIFPPRAKYLQKTHTIPHHIPPPIAKNRSLQSSALHTPSTLIAKGRFFECSNLLRKRLAYSLSLRSSRALLCIRSMVTSISDDRLYKHLRSDASSLMIRSHLRSIRRIRLSFLDVITLGVFKGY